MAINRVGSVTLLNDTLTHVTNAQGKLGDLQIAISSGIKSNDFAGLKGGVEQYTLFNAQQRRADKFISENTVTISKMQTASTSIASLTTLADNMLKLIVNARNGAVGNTLQLDLQMKDYLKTMGSMLNVSFAGNYIFGGTNSSIPPVPDTSAPPVTPGIADASYYVGSDEDVVLRVDELTTFAFPVRADDPAFQKIYAAAHLAIDASKSGSDTLMAQAQTLMGNGQKDLNSAQSRISNKIINTQSTNTELTKLKVYWKGLADDVSKTDLVTASTQVSSYESVLRASFQVYARISQLRLSDYLK